MSKRTCSGHCCRSFSISLSPAEVLHHVSLPKDDPQRWPEIDKLHSMLIYLGDFPANPLMRIKGGELGGQGATHRKQGQ